MTQRGETIIPWRLMDGSRKLLVRIFSRGSIVVKFWSFEKKKVTLDRNKLAEGVSAGPESPKADPASKWLNLAFVETKNQSRSLAHNLSQ